MLQNTRVAAFTVSEILRENERGQNYPPTQIMFNPKTVGGGGDHFKPPVVFENLSAKHRKKP